jgi:hypothetical protein
MSSTSVVAAAGPTTSTPQVAHHRCLQLLNLQLRHLLGAHRQCFLALMVNAPTSHLGRGCEPAGGANFLAPHSVILSFYLAVDGGPRDPVDIGAAHCGSFVGVGFLVASYG